MTNPPAIQNLLHHQQESLQQNPSSMIQAKPLQPSAPAPVAQLFGIQEETPQLTIITLWDQQHNFVASPKIVPALWEWL